jgi:hypothetical protein
MEKQTTFVECSRVLRGMSLFCLILPKRKGTLEDGRIDSILSERFDADGENANQKRHIRDRYG